MHKFLPPHEKQTSGLTVVEIFQCAATRALQIFFMSLRLHYFSSMQQIEWRWLTECNNDKLILSTPFQRAVNLIKFI